jgi:hypothetical protein
MTQKNFFPAIVFVVCTLVVLLTSGNVMAESKKSISRVLDGPYDEFIFSGEEGQILFAEIKSEIFQSKGRMGGDHGDSGTGCSDGVTVESCDTGSTDSCSDDDSGGCSCDDHSGGGRQDLCLQVLVNGENKICWAGRPVRPGWQRDPKLACPLPVDGIYILRVFIGQCGSTDATTYTDADSLDPSRSYQLYVELKNAVEDGEIILAPK